MSQPATSELRASQDPDDRLARSLLRHERKIGELLVSTHTLEHEIVTWIEPRLELRRRELADLERKLSGSAPPEAARAPLQAVLRPPVEDRRQDGEIAVVLLCRDRGRALEETLASVLAQTRPPSEVVLVDDGSTDLATRHLLALLGRRGHRIVTMPRPNGAAARNSGIRSTRAPLVAVFDAGAVLEPACLEDAVALLERSPELGFVAWADGPAADVAGVLADAGARSASLVRRRVWETIGGYDEGLGLYEETDFQARALERGFAGARLGERLLDHPLRRDSPDPGGVDAEAHVSGMRRLYENHAAALGDELLAARERFLRRERNRLRRLSRAAERMASELERIAARTEALVLELRRAGREPIDWGDLRRTTPLSHFWGVDRGQPVDRVYVEDFLDRHRADVRGRVVEIRDAAYTVIFGDGRVEASDVIDLDPGNPEATLVVDLARADAVPAESFDCFILTQTLNVIYDVRAALGHAFRILKPEGVLLCTVSALNRVTYGPGGRDGDFWRFTEASLRRLFAELAPLDAFEITPYGNLLACVAFLYGMTAGELTSAELFETDPYFPLIYSIRLVKSPEARG